MAKPVPQGPNLKLFEIIVGLILVGTSMISFSFGLSYFIVQSILK